jgi:hypothetical protein
VHVVSLKYADIIFLNKLLYLNFRIPFRVRFIISFMIGNPMCQFQSSETIFSNGAQGVLQELDI